MFTNKSAYLSPKLTVRQHPKKGGWGVFAQEPLAASELIVVWCGEVFSWERFSELPLERQQHSIQIEEMFYLASLAPDEPADYINHSCDPNAGLEGQLVLRAMRAIAVGEEICYDYAMSDGSLYDEFDCGCGSPNCRQRITGEDWRSPVLQSKYKGWFSPYIQRRIDQLILPRGIS